MQFSRVRVINNKSLPHDVIRSTFNSLIDRTVLRSEVDAAVTSLCEWYREQGYLFALVAVTAWPTAQRPILELRCHEAVLGDIKLIPVSKDGVPVNEEDGSKARKLRTKTGTIARATGMKFNEPFRWNSEAFEKLLGLDLFEKAKVEVSLLSKDSVCLNVYLCELPKTRLEPGVGMTHNGEFYGDVSFVDNNFLGRAQKVRLEWQRRLDMNRSAGGIEFHDPRIGSKVPISYGFRAYRKSDSGRLLPNEDRTRGQANGNEVRFGPFRSTSSPELDSDRDGAVIIATYELPRMKASISTGPIVERIHWKEYLDADINHVKKDQIAWKSIIRHVTTKPDPSPREGHRFSVEHVVGRCLDESRNVFHKLSFNLAQHIPVSSFMHFSFSSEIGFGSDAVPLHDMTVLGGHSTLRGYTYGELGRTSSWRTTRLELRIPLQPMNEHESGSTEDGNSGDKSSSEKESGKLLTSGSRSSSTEGSKLNKALSNVIDRMPSLMGYIFVDSATRGALETSVSGSSYGAGVRIAGMVNVEFARGAHGRVPRLNIGLAGAS